MVQGREFFEGLVRKFTDARELTRKPLVSGVLGLTGLIIFVVVGVSAWKSIDLNTSGINWLLLVAVGLCGAFVSQSLNAIEFLLMARALHVRVALLGAFVITVVGSAANQLPVPGSLAVRMSALKTRGVAFKSSALSSVVSALMFLGLSFVGLSIALLSQSAVSLAFVFLAVAVGISGLGWTVAQKWVGWSRVDSLGMLFVEGLMVLVAGIRAWFFVDLLGLSASFSQLLALSSGAAISTTVGILPAGLGLTELLAGVVAIAVGLGAAFGLLIAAIDRVFRMAFLAVATVVLLLTGNFTSDKSAGS